MTSTVELLELKDNINDVADFCQPDEFLDIFNFDRYYTDTGMDMSYEEFSHLEPFDEEDVQPVKEASPDLDQPSTPDVLDPTMKVPSDLSAETPSKLSVPICMIAIGTVDNDGVCESEPLPNLLKAPISGVLDGTACESVLALKDSETSEVVDDKVVVPKPSEVKTEQSTIYVQQPLDLAIIDLTESSGEESAPPMTLRKVKKDQNLPSSIESSTALLSKKRKPSESQDNVLRTGRCTRRKTSFRKHLSDENVFLVSSVEDIEKLLENRQEMALAENTRVGLIELKNKFLAWGVHDQRVTEEWEEVTNWY
ncbi:predicted protein [Sclerotinia sclerotiorum 1980 UF-70]|uniref:Uncharacterized protein n=2 Tax=Sclerotinia sclerotiorum (strain ATCC 18683 / 1980 / Ss-1) TaxID=665079 RepID=A0A1D9QEM3_SCLS1|nr:predicted protein [Sclerotinia sclerotiorum 1980 UF-70]APA13406.1 hypothetical protein sscle_11g081760 [Sclerotinia sclerotiorum 1980 UF-70]EDN92132.1 predicted protein [Sclerotinia sclerotiorum 1980 UF-70]